MNNLSLATVLLSVSFLVLNHSSLLSLFLPAPSSPPLPPEIPEELQYAVNQMRTLALAAKDSA